jgi:hypothetical protein
MAMVASPAMPDWLLFLSRRARRFRCAPGSTNAGDSVGNTFAGQTRRGLWHFPAMPGPRSAHNTRGAWGARLPPPAGGRWSGALLVTASETMPGW